MNVRRASIDGIDSIVIVRNSENHPARKSLVFRDVHYPICCRYSPSAAKHKIDDDQKVI